MKLGFLLLGLKFLERGNLQGGHAQDLHKLIVIRNFFLQHTESVPETQKNKTRIFLQAMDRGRRSAGV